MEKIYALITDGVVENTIVADDAFIAQIQNDYDYVIRIDEVNPRPGPDWTYDGNIFTAPPPPPQDPPPDDDASTRLEDALDTIQNLSIDSELKAILTDLITLVLQGN